MTSNNTKSNLAECRNYWSPSYQSNNQKSLLAFYGWLRLLTWDQLTALLSTLYSPKPQQSVRFANDNEANTHKKLVMIIGYFGASDKNKKQKIPYSIGIVCCWSSFIIVFAKPLGIFYLVCPRVSQCPLALNLSQSWLKATSYIKSPVYSPSCLETDSVSQSTRVQHWLQPWHVAMYLIWYPSELHFNILFHYFLILCPLGQRSVSAYDKRKWRLKFTLCNFSRFSGYILSEKVGNCEKVDDSIYCTCL